MTKLPYLNLGCGITHHADWTNVDFVSTGPDVQAHNLLSGVPFKDNSFEVVYHSHVLEHFPKDKAVEFLKECNRVLKPSGIIRVAIPDLEMIVRNYLKYLEEGLKNTPGAAEKYEWSLLEMYDQVVRTIPGGDMINYIKDSSKNNDAFVLERNGKEVQRIIDSLRNEKKNIEELKAGRPSLRPKNIISRYKTKLIKKWLGEDYDLLQPAKFRSQGEIHQWMYDRYSLKLLLEKCGFKNAEVKTAFESGIKDWNSFELDGNSKTKEVRKPDSLFMEARK